jgi:hypothetical protein
MRTKMKRTTLNYLLRQNKTKVKNKEPKKKILTLSMARTFLMRRLETEKDNDDMITLVKVELNLPTNTTLSTVEDKNISPLKNAAGVTRTEVRELQKKEKEAVIKILVNKIEESNPSNSTSVQT